ncbi:hypothetical protein K0M31_007504 [Melipona bicolor]|uniref:Uncharacterized protein n=1 Tax=Melipona bicolor TaxID=60889 RepID=A0AA40GBJ5_9HYME|nr:hypothetical protein K0M31_007504 [Melipona bicolor]
MKERKDILGPLKMKQIFLPGTHNSAIYDENGKRTSIISDLAVTQDLDIWTINTRRVRYLDIRVAYYPDTKEMWWTSHGPFYRSVSLKNCYRSSEKVLDNTEKRNRDNGYP